MSPAAAPDDAPPGRAPWLDRSGPVLLLCLALAFLAHGGSVGNGFYNDDALFLNQASRVAEQPALLITERPLGYFRPTWSAYVTVQWMLFGLAPAGYHVTGIALHGLTGFLVWRLVRRVLRPRGAARGDPLPPLLAAAVFVCFFAHAEGVLWIAAHNSVLACALCVTAVLAHLRAVERGGVLPGLATALLALLAFLAKEPSAVLLAWLPLAEMAVFGWRSPFTRAAWGRWAALAAGLAVFVALNSRVGDTFSGVAVAGAESRAALSFVTADGVLGGAAWMFSPVAHSEAHAVVGIAVLALVLALVFIRRRDLLPAALLGAALLVTAMAPASMTRFQQANGSRLYYFPTVGAALLAGTVIAALGRRRGALETGGTSRAGGTPPLVVVAALAWMGVMVAAGWKLDRTNYRPIGQAQTLLAEQLAPVLRDAGAGPVLLLEPWIDNLMHLQEFAQLYADVPPRRISRMSFDRAQAEPWIAAHRAAGALVLDWDEERGLVPAERAPPERNSAPGEPRGADAVKQSPRVRVMRIARE